MQFFEFRPALLMLSLEGFSMSMHANEDLQLELLVEAKRRLQCSLLHLNSRLDEGEDPQRGREARRNFLLAELHLRILAKTLR